MLENMEELESKLGIPQGFISNLAGEDDWSFVIKLNALFEATATQALVVKSGLTELEDNFSYIDFGNSKFGKVALLKKLGCITAAEAKFLQMLFELRNKLAHNIRYVTFTFESHLASLDKNQTKSFVTAVKCGNDKIYWNCEEQLREKYVLSHTKILILLTAMDILVSLNSETEEQ